MNRIAYDPAQCIFEPFWDGGESNHVHNKYSVFRNYTETLGEGALGGCAVAWDSLEIRVERRGTGAFDLRIERDCDLPIGSYDTFVFFGSCDPQLRLTIDARIDGQDYTVIDRCGGGRVEPIKGALRGGTITHLTLSLKSLCDRVTVARIFWLGMERSQVSPRLDSIYSDEWEGCFEETFEIAPSSNMMFDREELIALRQKLKQEPFLSAYRKYRNDLDRYRSARPEDGIGMFLPSPSTQFGIETDPKRPRPDAAMITLAFCGIIEENAEDLRLACRYALSMAHCEHWCEHIMGEFPGAVWHHRSFTEFRACLAMALVLDWAGTLLTWHGKNILYNAIIMKGLPRLDADFKTMDYLYSCNQSFYFNIGRIAAGIALVQKYPRYESLIEEAERALEEMVDRTVLPDGGTPEGADYWGVCVIHAAQAIYLLSRYRRVPVAEYVSEKLKKLADFGLAILSDINGFQALIPLSDAHLRPIGGTPLYCLLLAGDERWKACLGTTVGADWFQLIAQPSVTQASPADFYGFRTWPDSGVTSLRRKTEDLSSVHLFLYNGPSCATHSHEDKGSFVLEAGGEMLLCDPGVVGYGDPQEIVLKTSAMHNLTVPLDQNGIALHQLRGDGLRGVAEQAEYADGCLRYRADTSALWGDEVRRSVRSVTSQEAHTFLIEDELELNTALGCAFQLVTNGTVEEVGGVQTIRCGEARVRIEPQNYTAEAVCEAVGGSGRDDENGKPMELYRLRLILPPAQEHRLITRLTVERV